MGTPFAEAFVEIAVDNARLRKELGESKSIFSNVVAGMAQGAGQIMAIKFIGALKSGLAQAGHVLTGGLFRDALHSDLVEKASLAEDAQAQLAQVVKATGGAAGFTAERLEEMAASLSNVTTFSKTAVTGAEAALLTFSNIKGDNFERALSAATDLSALFGGDLSESARILGKALEEPEEGLMALRRAGIVFSKDQKDTIKSLQDTGKMAEAQRFILDALDERMGGVGKAMAQTFGGQMKQAENSMNGLKAVFGRLLMPALEPVVGFFKDLTKSLQGMEPHLRGVARGLGDMVANGLSKVREFLTAENFQLLFEILRNVGEGIIGIFQKVGEALAPSTEKMEGMKKGFAGFLDWMSLITMDWDKLWKDLGDIIGIYINAALDKIAVRMKEVFSLKNIVVSAGGVAAGAAEAKLGPQQKGALPDDVQKKLDALGDAADRDARAIIEGMNARNEANRGVRDQNRANKGAADQQAKVMIDANQKMAALNAMGPMEILKAAIAGGLDLPPDWKQRPGGQPVAEQPGFVGPRMPAEQAAGFVGPPEQERQLNLLQGLGGVFAAAAGALEQAVDAAGPAIQGIFNMQVKQEKASFTGLNDMYKKIQEGMAGGQMLDVQKEHLQVGKDQKGLLGDIKNALGKVGGAGGFAP